jgi:peptide/nickel transport system substrate-binding protein
MSIKKKIVWMLVSCLMVLSLGIASCGQKTEEEAKVTEEGGQVITTKEEAKEKEAEVVTSEKEMVSVTLTKLDGTTMAKTKEKPQYGGTITTIRTGSFLSFDPYLSMAVMVGHMQLTSNELMQGTWACGPAGTGDVDWLTGFAGRYELEVGELAESWELPDDETIIYHIHKGVHYQNKPPVNGRELIADDVAWWLETQYTKPGLWQNVAYPPASGMAPTSFKALDKYTVEVKVPATYQGIALLEMGDNAYTNPPECWTQYGGWGSDWTKVIGTGPFILTDYVTGSSVTYTRNPDYFEYDPFFPENRLPYIDTYKDLIIPDLSTRLAAFRTGKVDYIQSILRTDAKMLIQQCPDVNYCKRMFGVDYAPAGRIDQPPFNDIRVRQAMNLAVNQQEILDSYYDGDGEMYSSPFPPSKTWEPYYTPPEELPEEVTMLFSYDPDKARQLLTEAGYPDGFKTKIITQSTPEAIDYLSLIKEYLAAVGIDMEIVPVESSSWQGMRVNHAQKPGEMFNAPLMFAPDQPLSVKPGCLENHAWVDDPYYDKLMLSIGRDIVNNPQSFYQNVKEAAVYMLATAWGIWKPNAYIYQFWWPWVMDYNGIWCQGWYNVQDFNKNLWVDQALKKSMGY